MSIVPTQNGYIDTDAFGFKAAQDLGMQLQQRADQHQQFLTDQILNNQKMSAQDIFNHLDLSKVANPVDAQGNVQATPNVPPSISQTTSNPQPGQGNAVQDSATIDQLRNLPATQTSLSPDGSALQQNAVGDQGGGLNQQLLNLPQTQTNYNPGVPATTQPANISRTITYSDGQGKQQQYEIKTPEDIAAVDQAAARSKFQATAVPMKIDAATQKSMGVSLPDQIWVDPDHLAQYMSATGQAQPIPTSAAAQKAGLPPTVPLRNLAQVVSVMNNQNMQDAANQRNQANNDTKAQVAAGNNATSVANNTATNATRSSNNTATNATRVKVAGMKGANGTPGQQGVQNRFDQRRQDAQQKQLQAAQSQEDQLHAVRTQLGQDLNNPNVTDAQKTFKLSQLKTATSQIQASQSKKAAILGAQTPPQAVMDKIPEGTEGAGPDGHIWRKQGGIVYLVK
jgi:hypothetical protein